MPEDQDLVLNQFLPPPGPLGADDNVADFAGTVNISGALDLDGVDVTGDVTFSGDTTFNGNASFAAGKTVTMAGTNLLTGGATFSSAVNMGTGSTTFPGINNITGTAFLTNAMTVSGVSGLIQTGTSQVLTRTRLTVRMENLEATINKSVWVYLGRNATFTKFSSVIDATFTTTSAVLTTFIGGTGVTGGVLTIADVGSAAGVVDAVEPTALNVVSTSNALEIRLTTLAGSGPVNAEFTCEFDLS